MVYTINYLAVIVAALLSFFVGWAWYSPILFAKIWMKELGMSMDGMKPDMTKMMPTMGGALVQQLVVAYVLAHFAIAFGATGIAGALQLAFWVWLGFMATTVLGPVFWERRSWTWYAITAGHLLVTTAIMALIIVLWH